MRMGQHPTCSCPSLSLLDADDLALLSGVNAAQSQQPFDVLVDVEPEPALRLKDETVLLPTIR